MQHDPLPKTLDEAVTLLIDEMSEENKEKIRKMKSADLFQLHMSYGLYIRNSMGLWSGNDDLYEDMGMKVHFADAASDIILEALWKRLGGKDPEESLLGRLQRQFLVDYYLRFVFWITGNGSFYKEHYGEGSFYRKKQNRNKK